MHRQFARDHDGEEERKAQDNGAVGVSEVGCSKPDIFRRYFALEEFVFSLYFGVQVVVSD